jgi:hypothetical protein
MLVHNSQTVYLRYLSNWIIFLLVVIFLYFLTVSTSNDAKQYLSIITKLSNLSFSQLLVAKFTLRGEYSSYFLLWILTKLFSINYVFFILAFISVSVKYFIFSKYLHYSLLAFISYALVFMHILDANQIREASAICFIFAALFIEPKSKYSYLMLALIGMTFHYAAVLILSLYFARKFIFSIALLIITSLTFTQAIQSFDYLSFADIWIASIPNQVNFTSSLFLMQFVVSISGILLWKKLSNIQRKAIYFNTIGVVVYLLFYNYPIIAHRVRELTQISIIPLLFFDRFRLSILSLAWPVALFYYILYNLSMIIKESNNIYNIF